MSPYVQRLCWVVVAAVRRPFADRSCRRAPETLASFPFDASSSSFFGRSLAPFNKIFQPSASMPPPAPSLAPAEDGPQPDLLDDASPVRRGIPADLNSLSAEIEAYVGNVGAASAPASTLEIDAALDYFFGPDHGLEFSSRMTSWIVDLFRSHVKLESLSPVGHGDDNAGIIAVALEALAFLQVVYDWLAIDRDGASFLALLDSKGQQYLERDLSRFSLMPSEAKTPRCCLLPIASGSPCSQPALGAKDPKDGTPVASLPCCPNHRGPFRSRLFQSGTSTDALLASNSAKCVGGCGKGVPPKREPSDPTVVCTTCARRSHVRCLPAGGDRMDTCVACHETAPGLVIFVRRVQLSRVSSLSEAFEQLRVGEGRMDLLFDPFRPSEASHDDVLSMLAARVGAISEGRLPFPLAPSFLPKYLKTPDALASLRARKLLPESSVLANAAATPAQLLLPASVLGPDPRTAQGVLHTQTVITQSALDAAARGRLLSHGATRDLLGAGALDDSDSSTYIHLSDSDEEHGDPGETAVPARSLPENRIQLLIMRTVTGLGGVVALLHRPRGLAFPEAGLEFEEEPSAACARLLSELEISAGFIPLGRPEQHGATRWHSFRTVAPTPTALSVAAAVSLEWTQPSLALSLFDEGSPSLASSFLTDAIRGALSGAQLPPRVEPSARAARPAQPPPPAVGQGALQRRLLAAPASEIPTRIVAAPDASAADLERQVNHLVETKLASLSLSGATPRSRAVLVRSGARSLFTASGKAVAVYDALGRPVGDLLSLVGGALSSYSALDPLGISSGDKPRALRRLLVEAESLYAADVVALAGKPLEGVYLAGTHYSLVAPDSGPLKRFHREYQLFLWEGLVLGDYLLAPESRGSAFVRQDIRVAMGRLRFAASLDLVLESMKIGVSDTAVLHRLKEKIMTYICSISLRSETFTPNEQEIVDLSLEGIPDPQAPDYVQPAAGEGPYQSELDADQRTRLRTVLEKLPRLVDLGDVTGKRPFPAPGGASGETNSLVAFEKLLKSVAAAAAKGKPGSESSPPGAVVAAKLCTLCEGPLALCGGYFAPDWRCHREPSAKGLECSRGQCGEKHIRLGRRGTACKDGYLVKSAPGGAEFHVELEKKRVNRAGHA